jgi:hypothetical protein
VTESQEDGGKRLFLFVPKMLYLNTICTGATEEIFPVRRGFLEKPNIPEIFAGLAAIAASVAGHF